MDTIQDSSKEQIQVNTRDVLSKKKSALTYQTAIYHATWRWHFYAGLLVIPFLLMLSITGMVMLYDQQIQDYRYDGALNISAQETVVSPSIQLEKVMQQHPQAQVKKFIQAHSADKANFVVIKEEGQTLHIAINPYTGELLAQIDRDDSWYALANDIHGSLLLGDWGDRLIEAATGLIILLIFSGLFLWASPKNAANIVWFPTRKLGKRVFYRQLHSSLGVYSILFLIFFTLSGLSWSGVWGSKLVQAWSSFPSEKRAKNVQLSQQSLDSLNQGVMEEMPWNLEQTTMPKSHQHTKASKTLLKLELDEIVRIAKNLNMQRYQIHMPASKEGVYTLTSNTMSGDIVDPRHDRTVHIDQYSGEVLVDIGFNDYSLLAKAMAAGIALHQGNVSGFNLAANTLLCFVFILICITAIKMWWLRRPKQRWSMSAPQKVALSQRWYVGLVAVVLVSVLFPLTGVVIVLFSVIDLLVANKRIFMRRVVS